MTQEDLYQKIADTLASIDSNLATLLQNMVPSPIQAEERALVEREELDIRHARAALEAKRVELEEMQIQKAIEVIENAEKKA